ncbi:MAG: hypothetical protein R2706_10710 [Acidimicrobiales bacterium]
MSTPAATHRSAPDRRAPCILATESLAVTSTTTVLQSASIGVQHPQHLDIAELANVTTYDD